MKDKNPYKEILDAKLVAPSTVTGWRKTGAPEWAIAYLEQQKTIAQLQQENATLRNVLNLAKW